MVILFQDRQLIEAALKSIQSPYDIGLIRGRISAYYDLGMFKGQEPLYQRYCDTLALAETRFLFAFLYKEGS